MILNPYFWGAIGLALLLSFFGGCHVQKGRDQDRWDDHLAADKAATEAFNAETANTNAAHKAALEAVGAQFQKDKSDALAKKDSVIADLRSGKLQLRPQWRRCPAAGVPKAPGGAVSSDDAADLRETDAGSLVSITAACDAQVKGLQSVILTDRE